MAERTHHELIYRGADAMRALAACTIHICGVGALGSNLAVNLARIGVGKLVLIDRDRVEQHNIGTQVYALDDVGALKSEILRNLLYREVGTDALSSAQELCERNIAKLLKGAALVIDTFDNSVSRALIASHCLENEIACLHVGVNGEYGEVVWNAVYKVPSSEGEDICDYPLGRNLILLVSTIAAESIVRYVVAGKQENYSVTLGDLFVNREMDL